MPSVIDECLGVELCEIDVIRELQCRSFFGVQQNRLNAGLVIIHGGALARSVPDLKDGRTLNRSALHKPCSSY